LARALRDDEIRLRVSSSIQPLRIPIQPTSVEAVEPAITAAREQIDDKLGRLGGKERIAAVVAEAYETVYRIMAEGRELEAFRGKQILKAFHDRYGNRAGFSYPSFVYTLAQKVKTGSRLNRLVSEPVRRIQRYVPPELVSVLEGACAELPEGGERDTAVSALADARKARAVWEGGGLDEVDRSSLRDVLVRTARALHAHGAMELHQALLKATVEVGIG
jgi:hypothetical protein